MLVLQTFFYVVLSSFERKPTSGQTQKKTGTEGLYFYHPRLLYCPDQMLAKIVLRQHEVLSSKAVRLRVPCDAGCIMQDCSDSIRTRSAVCSEAPHSQSGERGRLHLCMDEWIRPTPVRRRLSLTQAVRCKLNPTSLVLVVGMKTRNLDMFRRIRGLIYKLSTQKRQF